MTTTSTQGRYHVNPSTGRAALCNATKQPCPLGGQHYATAAEAQRAYERERAFDNLPTAVSKSGAESGWTVYSPQEAASRPEPWALYRPGEEHGEVPDSASSEEAAQLLASFKGESVALAAMTSWRDPLDRSVAEEHLKKFQQVVASPSVTLGEATEAYGLLKKAFRCHEYLRRRGFTTLMARSDFSPEWVEEQLEADSLSPWDRETVAAHTTVPRFLGSDALEKLYPSYDFEQDREYYEPKQQAEMWKSPSLPLKWTVDHRLSGVKADEHATHYRLQKLSDLGSYRSRVQWTNGKVLRGLLRRPDCPPEVLEAAFSARSRLAFYSFQSREEASPRWMTTCRPSPSFPQESPERAREHTSFKAEHALAGLADTVATVEDYSELIAAYPSDREFARAGSLGQGVGRNRARPHLEAAVVSAVNATLEAVTEEDLEEWGSKREDAAGRLALKLAGFKRRRPYTEKDFKTSDFLEGGLGRNLLRALGGGGAEPPGAGLPEGEHGWREVAR